MTDLSLSTKCVKYLLFAFNLLFILTGIIILSVGASVHRLYGNYTDFIDNGYISTSAFLIAIGTIIFIISFVGCYGAIKENYCMIVSFTCLLILIFIFEFSAGISGYVLKDRTRVLIQGNMNNTMMKYKTSYEDAEKFDILQRSFKCCGITNYTDWKTVLKTDKNDVIPVSCCEIPYQIITNFTCNPKTKEFYKAPCIEAFGGFVQHHALTLGGVAIAFAFLQLIGILFACHLCRQIKRNYQNVS